MPKVAIILLNYNNKQYTKNCVRSLNAYKEDQIEQQIVIFDNHSQEPLDKSEFTNCDIVNNAENYGFAQGYNRAIAYSIKKFTPDFIVLLNNDTRVSKGWLSALLETSERYKNQCLVAPKIYFERGREFHRHDYALSQRGRVIWYAGGGIDWPNVIAFHDGVDEVDRGQFEEEAQTVFASGCCFLTTPKIWRQLGGFDPHYFMYYEDIDFCLRAKRKKIKIIFAPQSKIFHINAGSTAGGSGSDLQVYYQTRNRLRFAFKFATLYTKLVLLKEAYHAIFSGQKMVILGIRHALEGKWGKQFQS